MKAIKTYKLFTLLIILLLFSTNLSAGIFQNKLKQDKQERDEEVDTPLDLSEFFSLKPFFFFLLK